MKIEHSDLSLPEDWSNFPAARKAILIKNVKASKYSKLKAKLIIFKNNKDMLEFWDKGLNRKNHLCKKTIGAVNQLGYTLENTITGRSRLIVDKNYFCVIALLENHLTMEVITHESVHIGFAYAKRIQRDLFKTSLDFDEESICYPAGFVAASINKIIRKANLYK